MTTLVPESWKRHYEDYALKTAIKHAVTAWGIATSPLRPLPNFLIIGAQRAGTTSLYHYLVAHPAVAPAMPSKGVHYFDTEYGRTLRWYRGHFASIVASAYTRVRWRMPLLRGEASPYYLFHPDVQRRVAAVLPDAKLIVLLRNPVERAYSQHAQEVARGFETLSFEEALDRESERLEGEAERLLADPGYSSFAHQHHSYLARGLYYKQLERWQQCFPRDQFYVAAYERFVAEPEVVLAELHRFLGIEPRPLVSYRPYNVRERVPMRSETRQRLENYFAEPNRQLFDYLGVDFGWNARAPRVEQDAVGRGAND
jgi:Sulfotransferase domain